MRKMFRLFLAAGCLLAAAGARAEACSPVYLPPMPTTAQYPSLAQYQTALQAWQTMARGLLARSGAVQPPPMPMPYEYRSFPHYEEALRVWQGLFNQPGSAP